MSFDWSSIIEIDKTWYSNQLNFHYKDSSDKITVALHTVKVTGTTMLPDSLVAEIHNMLPDYVYGKTKIDQMGIRKASLIANRFFGDKNPESDGKYGELLLFALVETVLECKMVAHKIRSLSNMRDQVKGGDGLFLGNYDIGEGKIYPAYLLGESKVVSTLSDGLTEAFQSLNRFHSDLTAPEFRSTELIVAKENLILDDRIDIDELYARLNIESEEYKKQVLVHPVLIVFNTKEIEKFETASKTPEELEEKIKSYVEKGKNNIAKAISRRVAKHPEIAKVFLHFFLIPYNDVNKFRNSMYYAIHGKSYSK